MCLTRVNVCAEPSHLAAAHLDGNLGLQASPTLLGVHGNDADPDAWFQHNEPPALGITDYFEQDMM